MRLICVGDPDDAVTPAFPAWAGGVPVLPPHVKVPRCRGCFRRLSFAMALPESHADPLSGKIIALFQCRGCRFATHMPRWIHERDLAARDGDVDPATQRASAPDAMGDPSGTAGIAFDAAAALLPDGSLRPEWVRTQTPSIARHTPISLVGVERECEGRIQGEVGGRPRWFQGTPLIRSFGGRPLRYIGCLYRTEGSFELRPGAPLQRSAHDTGASFDKLMSPSGKRRLMLFTGAQYYFYISDADDVYIHSQ